MACKISGKIEFSHHGFVMAFSYAESEEKPRTRRGRNRSFGVLIQSFNNGNKTRILTNTVIAVVL